MNGNDPYTSIITKVVDWFQHPFKNEGSAFDWWLIVGLFIIFAWSWNIILLHLTEDL